MGFCSACGEEVEWLHGFEMGSMNVSIDGAGNMDDGDFSGTGDVNEWSCPNCGDVIARTNAEAVAIIRNDGNDGGEVSSRPLRSGRFINERLVL